MTKKHFEEFAQLIRTWNERGDEDETIRIDAAKRLMADMVVCVAAADNPRFSQDRFYKACGLVA